MLLRSLQWIAGAFLAAVVVTGLLIAIFGVNWMRNPIEEKTSRVLANSSDVIMKFSEPLPRIHAGAVMLASVGEDKDKQSVATGAVAIAVDTPQLFRKNMVRPVVRPERPVFRQGQTIGSRKNLLPDLMLNDEAPVRINRVALDNRRSSYDDALNKTSIRSERPTSHPQSGATTGSAVASNALEFARGMISISDAQIDRLAETFGPVARERLISWRALMSSPRNRAAGERQKLELVNDFMNRTLFKTDQEHWGKEDYWAMPIEFLSTNGGDCEDFAIAKYFTLRALGVPEEKLQITYVIKQVNLDNEAHMVLAYFPGSDAEPLILDNLNKSIHPTSIRTDLTPVYSFNGSGLWLSKAQSGRGQAAGSSNRIVQWQELQARMRSAA